MHIETIEIAAPADPIVQVPTALTPITRKDSSIKPASSAAPMLQEQAISIMESSNKFKEPRIYKEVVSNLIHICYWREIIENKKQNLENHLTWEYDKLLFDRKAIGSKWVFKFKYHQNGSVARFKVLLVAHNFSQIPGINFPANFGLTSRRESL